MGQRRTIEQRDSDRGEDGLRLIAVLVAGAWALGLAIRLWAGRGLPLWVDETWTGMIASQPDSASFWREAWLDVNPPLYYALMHVWTAVAGLSDTALRLPSLGFVIGAALLPLVWRAPGLSRAAALVWGGLLILWGPGIDISLDARGYGLLLLLSVAQAIAFGRLMASPSRSRASIWAALASLAILTHYFALPLAGLQGLAFVGRHRGDALRCWPAALAFLPAFGWLVIHLPRLADYARPDIAWYEPMTLQLAASHVRYVLGQPGWVSLALVAAALLIPRLASRGTVPPARDTAAEKALRMTVLCGVAALVITLGIGVFRPAMTERYLVPVVPSILLGLVLSVSHAQRARLGPALLIAAFAAQFLAPHALRARLEARSLYSFEQASDFARAHGARRLLFAWDHPASHILDPGSLAKLGGFFIAREGASVPTRAMVLSPGDNPNLRLRDAGSGQAGDAVIWIYNRARHSAARTHPPDPRAWAGWQCRHDRARWVGTLTCVQVAKPAPPVKVTP